jgi:deferrochelatase/peroxidase EfeB
MNLNRRSFLRRAGLGAITAGVAGAGAFETGSSASAAGGSGPAHPTGAGTNALEADGPLQFNTSLRTLPAVPFHGVHQAGILQSPQPAGMFASFNVTAGSRQELAGALKTITHWARFLTTGGNTPVDSVWAPPPDSGTLGIDVPADGLTITVGLGSSLFDQERFGLSAYKPRYLKPMEPFPNDDLDPKQTGGDVFVQLCAGNPDTTMHALRQITRATRGALALNWRLEGFVAPPRPTGVPRNSFGFKDGIANPNVWEETVAERLLWVVDGIGEPAWATGGTYHVVRIIQQFIEFWDRVSLTEQQQMIGRYRQSGAPLDGTTESDLPNYQKDPLGFTIPLSAHIRLANPRTASTELNRIFRRGYNYDRGVDLNGNMDAGLVFNAFQQNLERQFEQTQRRLIGEPMVDYVTPIGGGYFFALPGVRDASDWYGRRLFSE